MRSVLQTMSWELDAAARTIDGSGVDRIKQQGNEVSTDQPLYACRQLELHQGELVSADSPRLSDDACHSDQFGHGVSVRSAEPISSPHSCAGNRDITNQLRKHDVSEFCNGRRSRSTSTKLPASSAAAAMNARMRHARTRCNVSSCSGKSQRPSLSIKSQHPRNGRTSMRLTVNSSSSTLDQHRC